MNILEKIDADIKSAMKSKEKTKLTALKQIKTCLVKFSKDESIENPTDDQLYPVLQDHIAKAKKTIKTFMKAAESGNDVGDTILKETIEMGLGISYLPEEMRPVKELTEDELKKKISSIIIENEFSGMRDMGKLMSELREMPGVNMEMAGDLAQPLLNKL